MVQVAVFHPVSAGWGTGSITVHHPVDHYSPGITKPAKTALKFIERC